MKIGSYLVKNNYLSQNQLDDALLLQKDNPKVLLGDVLVTQGVFSKESLLKNLETYMIDTGNKVPRSNEWLSQAEIDTLIANMEKGA